MELSSDLACRREKGDLVSAGAAKSTEAPGIGRSHEAALQECVLVRKSGVITKYPKILLLETLPILILSHIWSLQPTSLQQHHDTAKTAANITGESRYHNSVEL